MTSNYPEIPAIEAIRTTRSMRQLETRAIPDDVLLQILDAAIRAPSGSNQQSWSFIVVTDSHLKQVIQQIYFEVAQQYFQAGPTTISDGSGQETMNRVRSSARHLADHLHEAPVLVFACIKGKRSFTLGASIYPAIQNLMIAARAYGIGSTLTTFHLSREAEVKKLLGIPEDVHTAALVPLGYPTGNWGEAKQRPVEEVT
ncbi:nitroreductase family protein [soil metagenome]